jgi:hypothetical protein
MTAVQSTNLRNLRLVILESPFAGSTLVERERNLDYARRSMRDSLLRGEAPFASHLLYTQPGILEDGDEHERRWGVEAGLAWGRQAEATVVYTDLGISTGMRLGIMQAQLVARPIEMRSLNHG